MSTLLPQASVTSVGVTSLEPQQAYVLWLVYAGAEGAREEDVPPDQWPLGPLLPVVLCMVLQSPDPMWPSYR